MKGVYIGESLIFSCELLVHPTSIKKNVVLVDIVWEWYKIRNILLILE